MKIKNLFDAMVKHKFIRFLIVGTCATILDFLIYILLSNFIFVWISKLISMLIASAFSFGLNKAFTFNSSCKNEIRIIGMYYIVFFLNMATNVITNSVLYNITNQKILSFIIATLCGMLVNYFGQSIFVFKKNK